MQLTSRVPAWHAQALASVPGILQTGGAYRSPQPLPFQVTQTKGKVQFPASGSAWVAQCDPCLLSQFLVALLLVGLAWERWLVPFWDWDVTWSHSVMEYPEAVCDSGLSLRLGPFMITWSQCVFPSHPPLASWYWAPVRQCQPGSQPLWY